jgi:AcrR family transcriptional regulator
MFDVGRYAVAMSEMPLVKSRREEYADATRAALLETARGMFARDGYQETGVEAVARATRVTRGAFYHHFADKRALFEALVIELQRVAASAITTRAVAVKRPADRLMAGIEAFLDACTDPAYRRLVIQEARAVLGSARCREIGERYPFGLLIGAFAELKRAGGLDIDDDYLAARMIGNMVCEAAVLMGDSRQPASVKTQALLILERTMRSFLGGKPAASGAARND